MKRKILKFLFDIGEIIIALTVYVLYVQNFFVADLNGFLKTSGIVFAGLATICSLTLRFASTVDEEDRRVVALSGEKLLHSTILFVFASIFGVFALQIVEDNLLGVKLSKIVKYVFTTFGLFFLIMSYYSAQFGLMWLLDTLFKRFDVRNRTIEDALKDQKIGRKEGDSEINKP